MFLSTELQEGQVYTRLDLSKQFAITDATLYTGIFRPAGFDSVLLFVTEHKTADRTRYKDRLEGDTLHWQGQTAGMKDQLIIQHAERGLELLVFYRTSKTAFPSAGFRYEGRFRYVSHSGLNRPTSCSRASDR